MIKTITSMLAMIMIIALVATACKDDGEVNPDETPTWLLPYQGLYSGTYDGDDTGTWTFTIIASVQFEMFVTSNSDNSTYSRIVTLNEQGIFTFGGPEIFLVGLITSYDDVSGSWVELVDDTSGDFAGEKQ
jgi:hypothetical protein